MESLLSHIGEIVQREQSIMMDRLQNGEQFNPFSITTKRDELLHSAIIADLLNPKGTHGQESLFLQLFLDVAQPHFTFSEQETIGVTTEMPTGDGRVDIMIFNSSQAIIIENKIDAEDQPLQLKRYEEYAKRHFGQYAIYYLTPQGRKASDQSGDEVTYTTISYSNDIVRWLEQCVRATFGKTMLNTTLVQYTNHIKQMTHQDTPNDIELYKFIEKYHTDVEALVRSATSDGFINYIYGRYVHDDMAAMAERFGLIYTEKDNINDGFYLYRPEWKKAAIRIYKDTKYHDKHYIGVHIGPNGTAGDLFSIKHTKMDCMSINPTEWAPYGWEDLSPYDRWESGHGTLPAMIDGMFVNHIEKLVLAILTEIDTKHLPML